MSNKLIKRKPNESNAIQKPRKLASQRKKCRKILQEDPESQSVPIFFGTNGKVGLFLPLTRKAQKQISALKSKSGVWKYELTLEPTRK